MTTSRKGESITTCIRKILQIAEDGRVTSYAAVVLHGEPRVLKNKADKVRFTLAGHTFLATKRAWNARGAGYIEAVEV